MVAELPTTKCKSRGEGGANASLRVPNTGVWIFRIKSDYRTAGIASDSEAKVSPNHSLGGQLLASFVGVSAVGEKKMLPPNKAMNSLPELGRENSIIQIHSLACLF